MSESISQSGKLRKCESVQIEKEFSRTGNYLQANTLALADGEECGITSSVQPLSEHHERFRRTLKRLLDERGSGSKGKLARYCEKESASWVSNLLVPRSKAPQLTIDDLWNMARFFGVSVGQLFGVPKPDELTGAEQQLLVAFRAVSPALQVHLLRVVEGLTISVHLQDRYDSVRSLAGSGHASGAALSPSIVADNLEAVIDQLTAIAAHTRRQTPTSRPARAAHARDHRNRRGSPSGETE